MDENATLGYKNFKKKKVSTKASKICKNTGEFESAPSFEMLKGQKLESEKVKRRNNQGSIAARTCSKEDKEDEADENMEKEIKYLIEIIVRQSVKEKTLSTKKYYFIMINYFGKTGNDNNDFYKPEEIAISEFSIKFGIRRTYHRIINFCDSLETSPDSSSVNQLPVKAYEKTNLSKVSNEILKFIYDEKTGDYGPLYTQKKNIHVVTSVLKLLKVNSQAPVKDIPVYYLHNLLFKLKNAACKVNEEEYFEFYHIIETYFEDDCFDNGLGICCDFHEGTNATKTCALSCVTRWCYIFGETLCKHFSVDLLPGRHYPAPIELNSSDDKDGNKKGTSKSNIKNKCRSSSCFKDVNKSELASHCPKGDQNKNRFQEFKMTNSSDDGQNDYNASTGRIYIGSYNYYYHNNHENEQSKCPNLEEFKEDCAELSTSFNSSMKMKNDNDQRKSARNHQRKNTDSRYPTKKRNLF